ncbi:damage-control phosphatase ARMT1 family protein [Streptacidiphilus sp. N1-12]|uniref:Damage-control phosphatase ARMT1 family protein n=2 Tax=Streptacidiphilus alkalitolerans TaxID=3342712 RepID=A0ABV6WGF2_9ACTN
MRTDQPVPHRPEGPARAPEIVGSDPAGFPWSVFHDRHPLLFQQLRDALPYPPDALRRLAEFEAEAVHGVIGPLEPSAHDRADWDLWSRPYLGLPWTEPPFLWAEVYFYRRLLSATGYFGPGPMRGVDPFAPLKEAELLGPAVDQELAALDRLAGLDQAELSCALLLSSLWGNRADLSFEISADRADGPPAQESAPGALLVDDRAAVLSHLRDRPPGRVCLIADNAARELLPDLVLLDHLLGSGLAASATLYVKPQPCYVSDATVADTLAALRRLRDAPGAAGRTGARLWRAVGSGRLAVSTHAFFCAPFPFRDMPDDLRAELASATLTLTKGDLNYRRLVEDRHWPATTPFAAVTAAFPGPVAALRTVKSDVVVGLDPATAAALESHPGWRTSGTRAVLQFRP